MTHVLTRTTAHGVRPAFPDRRYSHPGSPAVLVGRADPGDERQLGRRRQCGSRGGDAAANVDRRVVYFDSVHELGHSFVIRYFGQLPRIVLYMLGGLAITDAESSYGYRPAARCTPQQQIVISLAGPGAGFVLACATVGLLLSLGGQFRFDFSHLPFFYSYAPPPTACATVADHDR